MTLKQILGIAKELSTWIHGHTNEGDYANNPGLALLQQSQDICDAIIILIDEKLPGPAYALARPMLDSYVRGLWLLNHASDEEIEMFLAENKLPGFNELLDAIGNNEETGGTWVHKTSQFNRNAFHDLTHGGIEHVLRRITDYSIQPNYPEEELIRLMQIQIGIQLAIGTHLLALGNNQAGIEKLEEMAQQYGTAVRGI
ncbi:MAG: hypothetical protein E6Q60_01745 [Nitrosomonas oligotropha]|uniref:Uncharacterized protein n=1 Tax=Nitrosomonas oligotropha TaxID=42354 RepID=A0A5C7VZ75_9PROT|nr:MAG: hypothetical protein E6Q60_01745 [Nitrosomonas oligotropha]